MERIHGRKRRRTDEPSPQEQFLNNSEKKQRTNGSPPKNDHLAKEPEPGQPLEDISQWQCPPEFWDRLSEMPLIHSAVEELERRTWTRPSYPSPPTELAKDFTPAVAVELVRFARHGGPDLRRLRGYPPAPDNHQPAVVMSSPPRSRATKSTNPTTLPVTSKTTTTKKSTTPYNRGFEQHLTDHVIHPIWRSRKSDLEDTRAALAVPRRSLSPSRFSNSVFESFQISNDQTKDEDDVKARAVPVIIGARQHDHPMALNTLFGNLRPLTDGTLAPANPDIYYGAYPEELDRLIRNDLAGDIIPSTIQDKPMAPNFFLEIKGPDDSAAVAARQARYHGAFGARAMHALQNYGKDGPEYDSSAYVFSSTYCDGALKLYAHMTAPSAPDEQPEYYMTLVGSWAMMGTVDDFRRGATAFRNVRDLAKQHRDGFVRSANARASQARTVAAPADAAEPNEDDIPTPRDDVDLAQHIALQDADGELQQHIASASSYDLEDAGEAPTAPLFLCTVAKTVEMGFSLNL
ncbi:hypothetical protein MKX08_004419 [Trichoderma sp. CBMAI-0020]|nr:hypothetical protein MKX08_004419 [Trichoderma sp. CBMAI-0020]